MSPQSRGRLWAFMNAPRIFECPSPRFCVCKARGLDASSRFISKITLLLHFLQMLPSAAYNLSPCIHQCILPLNWQITLIKLASLHMLFIKKRNKIVALAGKRSFVLNFDGPPNTWPTIGFLCFLFHWLYRQKIESFFRALWRLLRSPSWGAIMSNGENLCMHFYEKLLFRGTDHLLEILHIR